LQTIFLKFGIGFGIFDFVLYLLFEISYCLNNGGDMEKDKVIIIAEDDTGHCLLMTRNLRRAGISNEIIHFADSEELLDFLFMKHKTQNRDAHVPYILLLDMRMPKIDGLEVLRRIKGDENLKVMPVVAISTTDEPDVITECYKLGCSFYISKSVDHIEFVDVLGKLAQFIAQSSVKLAAMAPSHQEEQSNDFLGEKPG
jgi:CheY-like chemotaxis protein